MEIVENIIVKKLLGLETSETMDKLFVTQLAGAVEYTDCISTERWNYPNKRPDMILNNLMVKLQ